MLLPTYVLSAFITVHTVMNHFIYHFKDSLFWEFGYFGYRKEKAKANQILALFLKGERKTAEAKAEEEKAKFIFVPLHATPTADFPFVLLLLSPCCHSSVHPPLELII